MNIIIINKEVYKLPEDVQTLNTVLNHLDLVKQGTKTHIKLYTLDDGVVILNKMYLNNSKIEINLA